MLERLKGLRAPTAALLSLNAHRVAKHLQDLVQPPCNYLRASRGERARARGRARGGALLQVGLAWETPARISTRATRQRCRAAACMPRRLAGPASGGGA
jgi:hypothetical protein